MVTDSSCGSIEIMEIARQRWKSRQGTCAMLSFDSLRALDFIVLLIRLEGIRVVAVGIFDEKHGFRDLC